MSDQPIMSVSGIRGIVGESFTPELCSSMAYCQTKIAGGGDVIIGRDTRPSGESIMKAICKGVRAAGGIPVDIGIAPTPTTCVAVKEMNAQAGIIITASHNPSQYNGYKMVHHSGRLYTGAECEEVYNRYRNSKEIYEEKIAAHDGTPGRTVDASALHVELILNAVDVDTIRNMGLSVAVDSINGAAGAVFPLLLEKLGVSWHGVNTDLSGNFAHNPEPRPEHLIQLSEFLKNSSGLNAGFGFDPDADRLITMGEHGEAVSEEMTLALSLNAVLENEKSDIVTNLSTSRVIDDVAEKFGVKVYRTKIGEANVVEGMKAHGCAVGGEGNGGVIYPRVSTARDGFTAMALIIELMARKMTNLISLVKEWSSYALVKEKIPCENKSPHDVIARLVEKFSDETTDTQDGLKIIREKSWVHVRPSNTEPIIRCYAEAPSEKDARQLADMIIDAV
ncbi:MAG: phosphoglucosamine mutase [Chitinivibrionales bacterium]|nr:phosphoglucosamine mutase [Chitinivibrionales bacterium]